MSWAYTVLLICILLAIFALWREFQRENKLHLWWRVAAVIIAITTLACIILPVSYESEISLNDKNQAVLLTDGFNADSLSSTPNCPIYTFSKKLKQAQPKATLINSLQDILNVKPAVSSLKILGYGLDKEQLRQLNNLPVHFVAAKQPQGISAVSWNQQLKTGEKLMVQGKINNTSNQSVTIVLKGLGTTLDSAVIPQNAATQFNLSGTPRHAGRALYRLLATSGSDTIANESIPVEVTSVKPLNVLILAAAPNFENKFLKDWLAANSYGVAMRSMISKDKFSQDFANVPQESLGHLTPSLINKFDVVVSDADVLKALNPSEASALKEQVLQKGTGIIVRADSTSRSNFWLQQSFPVSKISTTGQVVAGLKIQGQNNVSSKLLVDPVYISYQSYTQPLVTDQQNHLLASSTLAGNGKEIFTTINNTHSWMLSGNEKDYTALWSLLITKAARHTTLTAQWLAATNVPTVNAHNQFQLETSVPEPEIRINQSKTAAVEQPNLPFAYAADYWPAHFGWQQVQQGKLLPQWLYVYPQTEWQVLRYNNNLNDTRAYAALHNNNVSVTKQIHQKVQNPVSKIYFYLLLLAACTYLWAEAKFSI